MSDPILLATMRRHPEAEVRVEWDGRRMGTTARGFVAEYDDALSAARTEVLAKAVEAFNDLHGVYGNTTACWGGVGGQAVTFHCAVNCDNPKHEKAQEAWRNIVRAAQGDPDAMVALVGGGAE